MALLLLSCAVAGAAEEPVALPVVNPGFERGFEAWANAAAGRFGAFVSLDRQMKRTGETALHVRCPEAATSPWLAQSVPAHGGATYLLKAWCRGAEGGRTEAALKIEFYNEKGENTSGRYSPRLTPGSEWRELAVEAKAPPDTIRAAILVRQFGSGEVWFDDVTFFRVGEAPLITVDPPRVAAVAGTPGRFGLDLRLREAGQGAPPRPEVMLLTSEGRLLPGVMMDLAADGSRLLRGKISAPALAPGDYVLRFALPNGHTDCRLAITPAKRKPRNLTEEGVLLANGKPFFPIGLYHVSPSEYALLAEYGFNCVQGLNTTNEARFAESLELARKAGILVDVPFYIRGQVAKNLPLSLDRIRRFREHPAVLNWKIIDEPDLRPEIIDEVADAYRKLREADWDRPLLLTIASPPSYGHWAYFCDILQIDPYPIPNRPLTMVSDYCDRAKATLQPWQNLTAVLQCGWLPGPPANQPTYEQARAMVYLSVIHGAKGIFWYSMHDPGWDLTKTPLWPRFKELNAETAELGALAILGKPVEVVCDTEEVHAAAWEREGRVYIMATNPGKEARTATLKPRAGRWAAGRSGASPRVLRGEAEFKVREGALLLTLPAVGSSLLEIGG
jgi:hypothetical protein